MLRAGAYSFHQQLSLLCIVAVRVVDVIVLLSPSLLQAWTFDNEQSAPVGYKLAFNYLKANRCVEVRILPLLREVKARNPFIMLVVVVLR